MAEPTAKDNGKRAERGSAPPAAAVSEKQRRELWIYMAVSIVAMELLVFTGALFYGFFRISVDGAFRFPWLSWGAIAVTVPTLVLLLAHLADVGLFRPPHRGEGDEEWQKMLPERVRKLYRVIKGAPIAVVLFGVIALGAVLMTLDGALSAVREFGASLLPHLPWIIGGACAVICVIVLAVAWLHFRTRRLIAEYEFRREVLEKTGVIIVDKGSAALPPGGGVEDVPYALVSGTDAAQTALPPGEGATEETAAGDQAQQPPDAPQKTPPPESGG